MKKLRLTHFLAAVLLASNPLYVNAGPEGGGGGNSSGVVRATNADLETSLIAAKFGLKLALNALEKENFRGEDKFANTMQSVVKHKSLRSRLNALKIVPQGPACEHINSITGKIEKKEASLKGNTVCVSTDEILNRGYSAEQIFPKIVGLLGHELTHALGILSDSFDDEVLADQFGHIAERRISIMHPMEFLYEIDHDLIVNDLKMFDESYDAFLANSDAYTANRMPEKYAGVCTTSTFLTMAASDILTTLELISARVSGSGLALVSQFTEDKLNEAISRLALIPTTACEVTSVPGINYTNFAAAFKTAEEVSLLEIYRQMALAMMETRKTSEPFYEEMYATFSDPEKFEAHQCEINQSTCQKNKSMMLKRIAYGDIEAIQAEAYKAKLLINIAKGEIYNLLSERNRVSQEIRNE